MDALNIELPTAFKELFIENKYRYKIYYGGRGGAKTLSFIGALLLKTMQRKMRILCVREIQKSIKDSVWKNLKDFIEEHKLFDNNKKNVWDDWDITDKSIRYKNGSEFIFCGLKNNSTQIKSMANIDICWVEEGHAISYSSLKVLCPTIRNEGSEIWFSFNRETENDPVFERFCVSIDDDVLVREVNYYDNPFFPDVLEKDRLRDLKAVTDGRLDQDEYDHIWLGKPKSFMNSSYYGKCIRKAEKEQRICKGVFDETLKVHTVWDLGMADAMSIWFFQLYGMEIRLIDYYENSGEGIQFYVDILNGKEYRWGDHFAPHDIKVKELGTGQSRLEVASRLGLDFNVLPPYNISDGIQLVRSNFHRCYFDSEKTSLGLKCLKNYRKEYDEKRACYKEKPYHDWTSHASDAFRYLMHAATYISPISGYHKSESEFYDDYIRESKPFDNQCNKITGY